MLYIVMRAHLFLGSISLLLGACVMPQPRTPIGTPGLIHASYALGYKNRDDSWNPADEEALLGIVDFDHRLPRFPAWLVAKALLGYSGDVPGYVVDPDAESSGTAEFCLGLRKYTTFGELEPFVSGGVAILYGSINEYRSNYRYSYSHNIHEAAAVGGWVDAGFHLPLSPAWGIGLVLHYSHGNEQGLGPDSVQLGGTSVLITIGARW